MFRRVFRKRRRDAEAEKQPVAHGHKVVLRYKVMSDAEDDYAWRTDEELAKLDATRPLRMSFKDYLRYTRDEINHPSPRSRRFAIDTHEGKHIGNCMFYDIDLRQGQAELGIMIGDREYWSRGYGTDTVNSLLRHIFTTTGIDRVYLHTLVWNQRARTSFAKSGFREIRPVRRNGHDFIFMEVWRTEWERNAARYESPSPHLPSTSPTPE